MPIFPLLSNLAHSVAPVLLANDSPPPVTATSLEAIAFPESVSTSAALAAPL